MRSCATHISFTLNHFDRYSYRMLRINVFIKSLAQNSDHDGAQHWGEGYGLEGVTFDGACATR